MACNLFDKLFESKRCDYYTHMENLCRYVIDTNILNDSILENGNSILERCVVYNTPLILQKVFQKGLPVYDTMLNKSHITNIMDNNKYYIGFEKEYMLKLLICNGYLPNNKKGIYNNDGIILCNYIFNNDVNEFTSIMLQLLKTIIMTSNDYAILGSIFNIGINSNKKGIFLEIQQSIQNKFLLLQNDQNKRGISNSMDDTDDTDDKIRRTF